MADYDNTNRGAGWKENAVSGKANVGGEDFYLSIIATGAPKPSHRFFLSGMRQDDATISGVLFRNDSGQGEQLLSGQISCAGGEYWVNVFLNKSDHEKAPYLDVTFKPKEDAPAAAPVPPGDDMPF